MLKNRFSVTVAYRGSMISSVIYDMLSLVSTLIIWIVVFSGKSMIAGLPKDQTILYLLLIPVISSLVNIFISEQIGYEIRKGVLSQYLLKPYSISLELFTRAIASKLTFFAFSFPIYLIGIALVMNILFPAFSIANIHLINGALAITAGFFLHFIMDLSIGYLAFWVGEVWAFHHMKRVMFLVFGGMLFPLTYLSGGVKQMAFFLPFQFMYYIPNSYLLGIRDYRNFLSDLRLYIGWFLFFFLVGQLIWKLGIKKYEAFGG